MQRGPSSARSRKSQIRQSLVLKANSYSKLKPQLLFILWFKRLTLNIMPLTTSALIVNTTALMARANDWVTVFKATSTTSPHEIVQHLQYLSPKSLVSKSFFEKTHLSSIRLGHKLSTIRKERRTTFIWDYSHCFVK